MCQKWRTRQNHNNQKLIKYTNYKTEDVHSVEGTMQGHARFLLGDEVVDVIIPCKCIIEPDTEIPQSACEPVQLGSS